MTRKDEGHGNESSNGNRSTSSDSTGNMQQPVCNKRNNISSNHAPHWYW